MLMSKQDQGESCPFVHGVRWGESCLLAGFGWDVEAPIPCGTP